MTTIHLAAILFALFLGPFAIDAAFRRYQHRKAIRERIRNL